ncbi:hypothetical protein D3C78_930820 [compost metagenome]
MAFGQVDLRARTPGAFQQLLEAAALFGQAPLQDALVQAELFGDQCQAAALGWQHAQDQVLDLMRQIGGGLRIEGAEVLQQDAVQLWVLLFDALAQMIVAQDQGVARLAGVDGGLEITAVARRGEGADTAEQQRLGAELATAEQLHGVVRHAHRQLLHLPALQQARQADLHHQLRGVRLAAVELHIDARAVVADEARDFFQRLAHRGRAAGDQGDRTENTQVLVFGHAQAEVGAIQLLRRALQHGHQGTQRHPRVFLLEGSRVDAKAPQQRCRVAAELAHQFGETGEGRGADQCRHSRERSKRSRRRSINLHASGEEFQPNAPCRLFDPLPGACPHCNRVQEQWNSTTSSLAPVPPAACWPTA